MKPGTDAGAMPANVLENIRPMLIAGLAKLAELVKKYAAPMYAPTAAGALAPRLVRAREKITSSRPSVAMISERKCGPVARCFVEIVTCDSANMPLAASAPRMQPAICVGM